jgi:hypothetical protein
VYPIAMCAEYDLRKATTLRVTTKTGNGNQGEDGGVAASQQQARAPWWLHTRTHVENRVYTAFFLYGERTTGPGTCIITSRR